MSGLVTVIEYLEDGGVRTAHAPVHRRARNNVGVPLYLHSCGDYIAPFQDGEVPAGGCECDADRPGWAPIYVLGESL